MLTPLLSLENLSVIAHRGGSKLRPENTVAAFDHAVALGADAIELDVHLSRDGQLVVIHDATLDRTTDARGPVASFAASELARVDAGAQFGLEAGRPFRERAGGVPRLDEVLDRYRDRPLVVEIKGADVRTAVRMAGLIRDQGASGRVIVGGFSYDVLDAVRRELPDVVTSASSLEARGALTRSYFRLAPSRPKFRLLQVPFRLDGRRTFGPRFVRTMRRGRLPVQVWVVDEPDEMRLLVGWGVTGLISDRPDLALQVVRPMAHGPRPKG
jgi:glycerophosphoryl diester phosphodiesterase